MRFYVTDLTDGLVRLDEDESRHARKVMRVTPGDHVELFDGRGQVASGKVVEAGRSLAVEVVRRRSVPRPTPEIELAVAIPKGDRAAVLAEKAAELGADRIIPLVAERSVVDPGEGKLDRLRRVAVEAAKQCGRAWQMEIAEPASLKDLLSRADHGLKLIADASGEVGVLGGASSASRVLVLIGPEGGWTQEERASAVRAGFGPWRLGPHILRIETAALAALAILRREA